MIIPPRIISKFDERARGLEFGKVVLELHVKHGDPRIVVCTEESFHLTKEEREGLFRVDGSGGQET